MDKEEPKYGAKFYLPKSLHKRLKLYCIEKEIDMSVVVERLIGEYLEKEGPRTDNV